MYSKSYITQLQALHSDRSRANGFGGKTKKLGKFHNFMKEWNPNSLLDYGCGKGHILADLRDAYPNTKCTGYDPAVPMFNKLLNQQFECVFSNDVLEHIEPNFLDDVLEHINTTATKYIWLRIDTRPARKTLPDGRNAHISLHDDKWWMTKLKQHIKGDYVFFNVDKKGKLDVAIEKVNTR